MPGVAGFSRCLTTASPLPLPSLSPLSHPSPTPLFPWCEGCLPVESVLWCPVLCASLSRVCCDVLCCVPSHTHLSHLSISPLPCTVHTHCPLTHVLSMRTVLKYWQTSRTQNNRLVLDHELHSNASQPARAGAHASLALNAGSGIY